MMQNREKRNKGISNVPKSSAPDHNTPGGVGAFVQRAKNSAKKLVAFEESKGPVSNRPSARKSRGSRSQSVNSVTSAQVKQRSSQKSDLQSEAKSHVTQLQRLRREIDEEIRRSKAGSQSSGRNSAKKSDLEVGAHFDFRHMPTGKICNYCRSFGRIRSTCRYIKQQSGSQKEKIQPNQPRKILQRSARKRVASQNQGLLSDRLGLPAAQNPSIIAQNAQFSQPPSAVKSDSISIFNRPPAGNEPDRWRERPLESDHIKNIEPLLRLNGNVEQMMTHDELFAHDQELTAGVKKYRVNLANSASDLQATLNTIQDLSASLLTQSQDEKIFNLSNGSQISVKVHRVHKLSPDVRTLLRVHQGNADAWFDDKMEFSLNVDPKYRDRCDISARRWDPIYDEAVDFQIQSYKQSGVIREMDQGEQVYGRTPLNVVANDGERLRLTMDAREINEFFAPPKINLPNVLHPIGLEGEKWYTKIDFSDAFNHVRFTKEFSRWFSFDYKNKRYVWQHMGFGWNMAPAVFQTIIEAVCKHIHQETGLRSWAFYDDILFASHSGEELKEKTKLAAQLLEKLGFQINIAKSEFTPTQKIKFLGFDLDQTGVSVTEQTVKGLEIFVEAWKRDKTYRFLLQILGVASWCSIVGRFIPHLTSELNKAIPSSIRTDKRQHDKKCSNEVLKHASDVDRLLDLFRGGIKFQPKLHDKTFIVYVDASLSGYFGFACGTSIQQIDASPEEKSRDIDTLEVLAVAKAIRKAPSKSNVIVKSDSNVALFSFMRGTSSNPEIRKIIVDIMKDAQDREISFVIQRVKSRDNKADLPSREQIPDDKITPWHSFWQISQLPLSWSHYMQWTQQIHEREPYRDQARSLLIMLSTKSLRTHSLNVFGKMILKEDQLYEGDAAKILATAVLQYIRLQNTTPDLQKGPQPRIIARIINRLGAAGALKWKDVQEAANGKLRADLIDERFLASRKDKLAPPTKFIDIMKIGGYAGKPLSSAMFGHGADYIKKSKKAIETAVKNLEKSNHDSHMKSPEDSDEGGGDPSIPQQNNVLSNLSASQMRSSAIGVHQAMGSREKELTEELMAVKIALRETEERLQDSERAGAIAADVNRDAYARNQKLYEDVNSELANVKAQLSKAQSDLAASKKNEAQSLAQLTEVKKSLTHVQDQLQTLSSSKSSAEIKSSDEVAKLKAQLAEAKAQFEFWKKTATTEQAEHKSQLQKQLEDAASEKERLSSQFKKDLETKSKAFEKSDTQLAQAKSEIASLKQQLDESNGKIAQVEKISTSTSQKASSLQADLKKEISLKDAANLNIKQLQSEVKDLEERISKSNQEQVEIKSQKSKLDQEVSALKIQLGDAQSKAALDKQTATDTIESLKTQIQGLNTKTADQAKQLLSLNRDLIHKQDAQFAQSSIVDSNKVKIQQLESQKLTLEKRIQTLEQQIQGLNDSLSNQSQSSPLLDQIRDLNKKLSDTTRKLQLLELDNGQLKGDVGSIKIRADGLQMQLNQANKSNELQMAENQKISQELSSLKEHNRKLVLDVQAKQVEAAARVEEVKEMSHEFIQFLKQSQQNDVVIRQYDRFVNNLQGKVGALQMSYQQLCNDFRSQVDDRMMAIQEAESLKVQNFVLQKNLSCAQWTNNAQGQMLQICYQSLEQVRQQSAVIANEWLALQSSAMVDEASNAASVRLDSLKKIESALPGTQPSLGNDALNLKNQLDAMEQGDPNIQKMACSSQPNIRPVATPVVIATADGKVASSQDQPMQHPDRTIAAQMDKGDDFIKHLEEIRKQKEDAMKTLHDMQSDLDKAKAKVQGKAPDLPPMTKQPKTLSAYVTPPGSQPGSKAKSSDQTDVSDGSQAGSGKSSKSKSKQGGKTNSK